MLYTSPADFVTVGNLTKARIIAASNATACNGAESASIGQTDDSIAKNTHRIQVEYKERSSYLTEVGEDKAEPTGRIDDQLFGAVAHERQPRSEQGWGKGLPADSERHGESLDERNPSEGFRLLRSGDKLEKDSLRRRSGTRGER